ncbi:alpha/beta hydrolase, partial [Acidobacteriia bacterium AH_259_A11_L15]|nr:alpha/beta hydrolase [Acidobacteriia bacterium AH_259_A11_L15]
MTLSSNSSTLAPARPQPLPWRTLAFLLLFLAGAVGSGLALWHLRAPLEFETFRVESEGGGTVPVDRVRRKDRQTYAVHFLLLHGYGANRRQLLPLAEVLAMAGADVYIPDLPGRGDHVGRATPRPPGGFNAAMETRRETRAALDVAYYLQRAYGVRRNRLVVVGHSMGGGAALDVAKAILPAAAVSLAGLEREVRPGWP